MRNRNVQAKVSSLRATVIIAAAGALALPAAWAGASPVPDPSPRTSSAAVGAADALDQLQEAYRTAPVEQRLRLHNAIVLVVNTGKAAL
ncbi:MAG TPA: hypothetical protein VFN43_09400 [Humibacillus sp.]|nr:hypothetical protein [Humibacillus sp.]